MRRYRRLRRRRRKRPRRPRYRRRIKRTWIRRPTAGTYYTKKYSTMNIINLGKRESTKYWKVGHYTTSLKEWGSKWIWDYYKILKMKITFYPQESNCFQHSLLWGHTVIDYDGSWSTEGWLQDDPYANSSTGRVWMSNKKHSRYFTPKPFLVQTSSSYTGQSLFYFTRNTPWLNCYDLDTKWGALLFSAYAPADDTTPLYVQKSVWIRFKTVL
ncbi:capsid protein [Wolvfec circovius]|uniref:Capsid protein n=1 Tax=Wolvfec circovius TaxID=2817738 RepID=A0AAX1M7X3_9CIRC|nr:capsid protein [Wolvfec circovius]QSX73452.1 capsid protein [Wolvfec circovius]